MRRHQNTLYVTTQGAYLSKEGESISVRVESREVGRIPVHTLEGIVCFGRVTCSPFLMRHCAENDVTITHLTESGHFLARVTGPVKGNVLLRRQQYRLADDREKCSGIARNLVIGKVINSRNNLLRARRDHPEKDSEGRLSGAEAQMSNCIRRLQKADLDLDICRGVEGEAANIYFSVFDAMITNEESGFKFFGRKRRPPLDPVNCLLSSSYRKAHLPLF